MGGELSVPGAQVQASGPSVLITLETHLDDLPTRLTDAHLVRPDEFSLTVNGVHLGQAIQASFATGQVATVTSTTSGPDTTVVIGLRIAAAKPPSVAVGAGSDIDITFS